MFRKAQTLSKKPKQRVLSLDPAGLLWGSERALLDFIGEIPGFEPACCCPPGTALIEKLQARSVRCFPIFEANLHLRGTGARVVALWGLLRALWAYRPDVFHINQAGATRIALLACRICRIPCVVHVRLQEDVAYLNRLKPSPKYLKQIIAISEPIASLIQMQPHLQGIPCAMLLDAYRAQAGTNGAKVSHEPKTKKWDFVCVGRFCESKGQEILIRAVHLLQQNGISSKLVFVGAINDCGKILEGLVKELNLGTTVTFTGHQDIVDSIISQSRWLVCPTRFEALGRVLFEAWDVGVPVVAGDFSGGAAGSVSASGGGFLFGEWTPVSLAAALTRAMSTGSDEADQIAAKGRGWLLQATDPARYAGAMAKILREAIHSFRRHP